jgi:soluble lytic murein transglycosylase-like protein
MDTTRYVLRIQSYPSPSSARSGILAQAQATCVPCPYYSGNNPSQSAIRAALNSAADAYHLSRNLLLAVAWQESRWHEDVLSCDGGIGLMQVQSYS